MKDFIYEGPVRIIYGAGQFDFVINEIAKLGKKVLIISGKSFSTGGHLGKLTSKLEQAGISFFTFENVSAPMLSKVNEGIEICKKESIEAVIGIGGGVCMDVAKAIALGALHPETPIEQYLTYQVPTDGLSHLPVVTIPTNPMSGSETNADVQITFDESGLQAGCAVGCAKFTWLNPEYMISLPASVLSYGQMTAFIQLSFNYLTPSRSMLAERYSEASMKTILDCLRTSIADPADLESRGTLLLNSALSLSGINDLGRDFEFIPYPLQSFAQRYLGISYPQALTGLFPYWLKEIYHASCDKAIFYRYFEAILGISIDGKEDETLLEEALTALVNLYHEFGIATCYKELKENPHDRQKLMEIIDSFGPMQSLFMEVTTEKLADIIDEAIEGLS